MKLIVANWKTYLGVAEATHLAERIRRTVPQPLAKVVMCPSFPALLPVGQVLRRSPYHVGAQDVGVGDRGPGTGEVAARDLRELGCTHVIVGHSERRALGETDEQIRAKFEMVVKCRMTPILCIGETSAERRVGKATSVIQQQLTAILRTTHYALRTLIIAYEPVWAIGAGTPATPIVAAQIHTLIRRVVTKIAPRVKVIRVLYGGSVTPQNAAQFLREKEIDGLLVGSASTKLSFVDLLKLC